VVVYSVYCALLLSAACSDLTSFRIPNWVSASLVLLFMINALPQLGEIAWRTHLLAGGLMLTGGLCLYGLNVMGAGDIKLLSAAALWLGLSVLPSYLVMVALMGLATALTLIVIRAFMPARLADERRVWLPASLLPGNRVPYGVAIALAALAIVGETPSAFWLW